MRPPSTTEPDHDPLLNQRHSEKKKSFEIPQIKITGMELLEFGFVPGCEIDIRMELGKITITKL